MNYFAHGRSVLDDRYLLVGTAVPDWLIVANREVRVPPRIVRRWTEDSDPAIAEIARGICRHHDDDAWFHVSPTFGRLCDDFRRLIDPDSKSANSHVAGLVAHIAIELLIDACLIEQEPVLLDRYFAAIEGVDTDLVERSIETITGKRPHRLGRFIRIFREEQFLRDYLDDDRLLDRMEQIMQRTRLGELPSGFRTMLPEMRRVVYQDINGLMSRT